jgi:hypothetical protein
VIENVKSPTDAVTQFSQKLATIRKTIESTSDAHGKDITIAIGALPNRWDSIFDESTVRYNFHYRNLMFRQKKVTDPAKLHSLKKTSPTETSSFDPSMRYYWFFNGKYQDFDLIRPGTPVYECESVDQTFQTVAIIQEIATKDFYYVVAFSPSRQSRRNNHMDKVSVLKEKTTEGKKRHQEEKRISSGKSCGLGGMPVSANDFLEAKTSCFCKNCSPESMCTCKERG